MGVQFAGNILVQSNGGPLPISQGGTGQTSAAAATNALLPTQTGNSGKYLTTDGINVSWGSIAGSVPGGSDTQIQYNNSGAFAGSSFLTINKSTGAITSTSTLTNTGLLISNTASNARSVTYQTSGSNRWIVQTDNTAETGSNVGSNFAVIAVADNGSTQNTALTITRATQVVDFKQTPTVNGTPIGASGVTSVGMTVPTFLSVTPSTITTSGTFAVTLSGE